MIRIRTAESKDAEQINNLHIKLRKFESKFDEIQIASKKTSSFSLNWFKKNINNKKIRIIVAEENNKIIGYIMGWIEYKKTFGPYLFNKKVCFITDLFILKEYRKKGIGKLLVKGIMRWFKSKRISSIELNVYTKSKSAIEFWKRMGLKEFFKTLGKKI